MEAEDLVGLAESEVITIRDDEDHPYYEPDEDDDAWHRARRGRYADDEAIESDAMDLQRAGGHSTDMDVDGAHKRPVVDQQPSVDGRGGLGAHHTSAGAPAPTSAAAAKQTKTKSRRGRKGKGKSKRANACPAKDIATGPKQQQQGGEASQVKTDDTSSMPSETGAGEAASDGTSTTTSATTPAITGAQRGQAQRGGRGGRGGRGRGGMEGALGGGGTPARGTGKRGMTHQAVERICAQLQQESSSEKVAAKLSELLHEKKMPKIAKILHVLGMDRTLKLFTETMDLERRGGMMVPVGKQGDKRRRTTGGVFLTLLKQQASKQEMAAINEEEIQIKKATRKRKRGGKGGAAKATTDDADGEGISTSRIRTASEDGEGDDERDGRLDYEVIESRVPAERVLPDRITVEIQRQNQHNKRLKRTVTAHADADAGGDSISTPQADDNPFGAVW